MEIIRTAQNQPSEARQTFEAQVNAAVEMALELERNLIQWGDSMEARRFPLAA